MQKRSTRHYVLSKKFILVSEKVSRTWSSQNKVRRGRNVPRSRICLKTACNQDFRTEPTKSHNFQNSEKSEVVKIKKHPIDYVKDKQSYSSSQNTGNTEKRV